MCFITQLIIKSHRRKRPWINFSLCMLKIFVNDKLETVSLAQIYWILKRCILYSLHGLTLQYRTLWRLQGDLYFYISVECNKFTLKMYVHSLISKILSIFSFPGQCFGIYWSQIEKNYEIKPPLELKHINITLVYTVNDLSAESTDECLRTKSKGNQQ